MKTPSHILCERLGDERIILDLKAEEYLSLNPTGTIIWEGLRDGLTVAEIVARVHENFNAASDADVERDVREFAQQLLADRLLE